MTNPPRTITITLPLPERCLHPNGRAHWTKKAAAARKAKLWASHAVIAAMLNDGHVKTSWGPPMKQATVKATFFKRTKHAADSSDWDGALSSLKPSLDGLEAAGVIENDRGFKGFQVEFAVDKADPRVEIEIVEITIR